MKRRPTEIPYIPKDKRRSRLAPREGGKILRSKKGVEALRRTDTRKDPEKAKNGCGCVFFLIIGLFAFSDQIVEFVGDVFDGEGPRIVTSPLPPPVQAPPTTIILEEGVAQAPRGDVRGVFTVADYPTASLRAEEQGTVRAIVTVGTDGTPIACDITQSSGYRRLDETTCSVILERARFAPALDADGQPVEGTYSTPPIRWEIPSR